MSGMNDLRTAFSKDSEGSLGRYFMVCSHLERKEEVTNVLKQGLLASMC